MSRSPAPVAPFPCIAPQRRSPARLAGTCLVAAILLVGALSAHARWPGTRTDVRLELLMPPQSVIPFADDATLLAAGSTPEQPNRWGLRVKLINASSGAEFFARADITVYEAESCWAANGGSIARTGDRTFAFTVPSTVCHLMVEVRPAFPHFGLASFHVQVNLSTEDEMDGLHAPAIKIEP